MNDLLEQLQTVLPDRYRLIDEVGSGGMAKVFIATDLKLDRPVAIKVLRPSWSSASTDRFLREIHIAANLHHPHIIPLHDSGRAGEHVFYSMPYIEGESLRHLLSTAGQLTIDESLRILRDVAAALDYAHRRGIVHRDIKPENILLCEGEAIVSDFGIAIAMDAATADRLTKPGATIGTVEYMSPEQINGDNRLDGRSDIYSLGCLVFELLAGRPPFEGNSVGVMVRHVHDPPPRIDQVRGDLPEHVAGTLNRALAKAPDDRFPTASEFVLALARDQTDTPMPRSNSIAVLPFRNLSNRRDDEYLSDGITEQIIDYLAAMPGCRVTAKTSSFAFKETLSDVSTIAKQLAVNFIVEGSIQRGNRRMRVAAQLVTAFDGMRVWSHQVDMTVAQTLTKRLKHPLRIQDEVAAEIALGLQNELGLSPQRIDVWKPPITITLRGDHEQVTRGGDPAHGEPFTVPGETYSAEVSRDVSRHSYDKRFRRLSGGEATPGFDPGLTAYRLYRMGIPKLLRNRESSLLEAVTYFQQAIDKQPEYTLASACLAEAYFALAFGSGIGASVYLNNGWDETERLGDGNSRQDPQVLTALGLSRALCESDWTGAERAFRGALSANHGTDRAHRWYGTVVLAPQGRFSEAVSEVAFSVERDPLDATPCVEIARIYWLTEQYDEALTWSDQAMERDGEWEVTHWVSGLILESVGRLDEAHAAYRKALELSAHKSFYLVHTARAHALSGDKRHARDVLDQLEADWDQKPVSPYFLATAYAALAASDAAFEWISRCYPRNDPWLIYLAVDPLMRSLRSDPRFEEWTTRLGLTP